MKRQTVYYKKINILLVEIINRNLGDTVIAENAAYLIGQALPSRHKDRYVLHHYNIYSRDFEMVRQADLIVFAGGGIIKYKREEFYSHVSELVECAQESEIPVYFNGVGIEGYDAQDERCQRLERALNLSCVKMITVRDDIQTLRDCYLHGEKGKSRLVFDPAVHTPSVYGVQRDAASNVIGLGIVRYRIFEDHDMPEITREFQLELWKQLTLQIEAAGYQWKLFVNGLKSDYDFAGEVLAYIGREQEADTLLVGRPTEGRELVETIASFAGIIACRMHANIIAYTLGVPSVGLVWNEKLVYWGERIGYPERFLRSDRFRAELVSQALFQSIEEGVRPVAPGAGRSVLLPLRRFLRTYGKKAWKIHRRAYVQKPVDWSKHLVATALGGWKQQYSNMNTPMGLENALAHGFCLLEADLRMTSDGILVCVNGWSKTTYEKLGADPDQYDGTGMDYQTFHTSRMYDGHYETIDADWLFSRMALLEGNWKLILDVGKPNARILQQMLCKLTDCCAGIQESKEHLFLRLQTKKAVEAAQAAGLPVTLMYYVPPREEREEKGVELSSIAEFCRKKKIRWVSLSKQAVDASTMEFLKEAKLKSCIFSYNTYTEICEALSLGADWIATSYQSVDALSSIYGKQTVLCVRGHRIPIGVLNDKFF